MDADQPLVRILSIAIPVIGVSLFVYKYADMMTRTTHFACPACRSLFKLSKLAFVLALKTGVPNERIVTCPACGYRGSMPMRKD